MYSFSDREDADEDFEKMHLNPKPGSPRKIQHKKSYSTPIYLSSDDDRRKNIISKGYYSLRRGAVTGTRNIIDAASHAAKTIVKFGYKLVSISELPEWLRDNIYIHHKHRPQLETIQLCFKSMFSIHTETGNIWTHFIALLLLLATVVFVFVRPHATKDGHPHFPLLIGEIVSYSMCFIGGFLCFMFSWLFHTLNCHSQKFAKLFARLDYSGISFQICGSTIPVLYYGFYCHSRLKIIYLSITCGFSVICIIATFWNTMSTPRFRSVRAIIFLAFGLSAIAPIVHHCIIHPYKYSVQAIQLYLLITMGSLYIVGTLFYVTLIPERLFPGKVAIAFQSHQIFHVFVVCGAFVHIHALYRMSYFRVAKGPFCLSNETTPLDSF